MPPKSVKQTKGRKTQRNVLYLPTEVRIEVEKIAIEVSYMRGRRISDSGFVQYLIRKYKAQAIKELINGADTPDE